MNESAGLIHELFEQQALRGPDAIAVSYKGQQLTYRELGTRSSQLASYLRKHGALPDDRIAICVERSLEMVVGLLGILKAGAAYVPLDSSYPPERLRYMIEDCKPVLLLTQGHLRAALPHTDVPILALDTDWSAVERTSREKSDQGLVQMTPANLAYVIYTSGSTGVPKGVMVEHRNVTQFLTAFYERVHIDPTSVWAQFHSFSFDVSVVEFWGALLSGARLIMVSYATSRFPRDLHTLLSSEAVSVLCQTPSAFRRLIAAQADSDLPLFLDTVILAGEALQLSSLSPWYERAENRRIQIVNMYGPTEATVYATYQPVRSTDEQPHGGSVIGTALSNSRITILDENCEPVPNGVVGEIYLGGAGVARGYLDRPDLTAERFVADPTDPKGARMYRSGDLGLWRADATVEYRGRNDSQVKVRGFRIELGEVESHLVTLKGVHEAVAVVRQDSAGDTRLVAYLTANAGAALAASELRRTLLQRLPVHMVPTDFVILQQFPLNSSGKIDRKALLEPDRVSATHTGPAGKREVPGSPEVTPPVACSCHR
jgi:amino acid adenylation domain-containing protein